MKDKRVTSAALTVHHNALCAYIVLNGGTEVDFDSRDEFGGVGCDEMFQNLTELCESNLPDYMVPLHFVMLDELPLNANGKVERDKLPLPETVSSAYMSSGMHGADRCAPSTPLEGLVLAAFAAVLNMDESMICCSKDSFFGLGGNSVTAIQLIFRIRTTTMESLTVHELFTGPTIRKICNTITAKTKLSSDDEVIEGDGYEIMCLKPGSSDQIPVLLFNPAGASGLW